MCVCDTYIGFIAPSCSGHSAARASAKLGFRIYICASSLSLRFFAEIALLGYLLVGIYRMFLKRYCMLC